MAGGVGQRLWPASTPDRPKQLVPGIPRAGSTLLSATIERLAGVVASDDVYVVTTRAQAAALVNAVTTLSAERVIIEPVGRNTAACIALGVATLRARLGPAADDAVLVVTPADHHVRDVDTFQRALARAVAVAREANAITLLGVEPTAANPGFGYIAMGPALSTDGAMTGCRVHAFTEKPDAATAQRYVTSTDPVYLWNAGIFVMPIGRVADEFRQLQPETMSVVESIVAATASNRDVGDADQVYAQLPAEPFDRAIVERQHDACVVPVSAGWSDLGSWTAIGELFEADEAGNRRVVGRHGDAELVDSRGCTVWTEDARVGVLGLDDVVVVVRGDRVLVCRKDLVQSVGNLAKRFDGEA